MTLYLGNAFSLGMLDMLLPDAGLAEAVLLTGALTLERAKDLLGATPDWQSCVGHADTALLLTSMLGTDVPMRRCSTSLKIGDQVLVAQYNGPRLAEGATSLPEGAKIRWILVSIASGSGVTACGRTTAEISSDVHTHADATVARIYAHRKEYEGTGWTCRDEAGAAFVAERFGASGQVSDAVTVRTDGVACLHDYCHYCRADNGPTEPSTGRGYSRQGWDCYYCGS